MRKLLLSGTFKSVEEFSSHNWTIVIINARNCIVERVLIGCVYFWFVLYLLKVYLFIIVYLISLAKCILIYKHEFLSCGFNIIFRICRGLVHVSSKFLFLYFYLYIISIVVYCFIYILLNCYCLTARCTPYYYFMFN